MTVYRIMGYVPCVDREGKVACLGFVRTEQQARKAIKAMKQKTIYRDFHYKKEIIGSGKDGLVNWLNDFTYVSPITTTIIYEVME